MFDQPGSVVMEAKPQKTTPVRLTEEAIELARIASGYTGESMAGYVSRIVAERAKEDADRLHRERFGTALPSSVVGKKRKGGEGRS